MKAFVALLALLPLVASLPSESSYATFSHHGQNYGYNHGNHEGSYHAAPHHSHSQYKKEPLYRHEPEYKPHHEPAYQPHHEPAYKPHHEPAYKPHHEPAYGHHAPAYEHHAPSYGHHAPSYGHYEQPKHNCTVEDVTESAEVCTPSFETKCENVELAIKRIVDGEYCYDVARTVCSESIEEIDNEVCTYDYQKRQEDTTAQTVEVTFKKETNVQMVTVCQPGYGHGYQSYGHQYCKEVAQETSYNVPVVSPIDVDVTVAYPEPIKSCVNKPISLPRISCEVVSEKKCVLQPEIEEATESVEKCTTSLGKPDCQQIELTLPKQSCVELVYGYAHEAKEH